MTAMKMGALDMMRADSRIISALGPIEPGSANDIAAAVHALASAGGPDMRFGLMPTPKARLWRYDPDAFLHEIVELPECSAEELPAVLTHCARTSSRSSALNIAVAGKYLIIDLSHGLGDAQLAHMLNQVLGERIALRRLAGWSRERAARYPLSTAIARYYGNHPLRAGRLIQSRRGAGPARPAAGDTVPWQRNPTVVSARSHDRSRYSSPAVVFAALASAIRSHGIGLHDSVTVMFDCRRYLPGSRIYGNFVSGVELTIPDPGNATQVRGAIHDAARCGRPLATLLLGGYKFMQQYRAGTAYLDATRVARLPRARLVFSDIGELFANSTMWSGDPSTRFYNAINESKDPEAIVFTITHRGGDIDVTATFHANVFSPAVVQSALDCVVAEPEHHLMLKTGR